MTGANLGGSEYKNTISADQVAAAEFKSKRVSHTSIFPATAA